MYIFYIFCFIATVFLLKSKQYFLSSRKNFKLWKGLSCLLSCEHNDQQSMQYFNKSTWRMKDSHFIKSWDLCKVTRTFFSEKKSSFNPTTNQFEAFNVDLRMMKMNTLRLVKAQRSRSGAIHKFCLKMKTSFESRFCSFALF